MGDVLDMGEFRARRTTADTRPKPDEMADGLQEVARELAKVGIRMEVVGDAGTADMLADLESRGIQVSVRDPGGPAPGGAA